MGPNGAGVVHGVGPIVIGTLTYAHDHKPDHVHNKVVSKQINMINDGDE